MWRVLYVEDNADSQELVQITLGSDSEEVEVKCVETVAQAIRSIRNAQPDLYLLDNRLPDGDGIDLCRWIRSFDFHRPVAILSASAYDPDKWAAVAAGCDVYLTKPVDYLELRLVVLRLLKQRNRADKRYFQAEG